MQNQGVNFSTLAKKYQNSKVGKMTFGALWLHSGPLCGGGMHAEENNAFVFIGLVWMAQWVLE